MKILWFSNCILSNKDNKLSGSWLYSMSDLLTLDQNFQLYNVAVDSSHSCKDIQEKVIASNFSEYILPQWKLDKNGFPPDKAIQAIKELCQKIDPEIIHVWGVENYFCNLIPTYGLEIPLLLEIQGLHGPCGGQVYYGDLSFRETLSCLGPREILFFNLKSIYAFKRAMKRLDRKDQMAFSKFKYISTQSQWVRDYIRSFNVKAQIFQTGMSIRAPFWNAHWSYPGNGEKSFYCSSAGPSPYKSIQTAIRALRYVHEIYPDCKLYIIGAFQRSNWIHQPGYLTFLYNLIQKLGLKDNVIFTGSLTAGQITGVMTKCIAMVQTSYIESYSLAVAEAQAAGVPSIISYAGAMPELAKDRESGLFFSPGDAVSCAARMIELIENKDLAESLSNNGSALAKIRNNDDAVLKMQLEIYKAILERQ